MTDLQSRRTNSGPPAPKEQVEFRLGKSTVYQVVLLTQNIENYFEAKKENCCRVCRSDSCLLHCLAPWSHLRAADTSAVQAHGPDDYGTCSEQKLHPDLWSQPAKQASTPEKW